MTCLVAGHWFSQGTPVSSTNKNDHQDITEILLKVALNTIANPMIPNHHTMKFVHLPSFSFKLSVGVFPNGKET